VSGGADSVINFWEDITESEELERIAEKEDKVLKYVTNKENSVDRRTVC
jgi:hypothetical protein